MISDSEFIDLVKKIYFHSCRQGIESVKPEHPKSIGEINKTLFISECHNGFKIAQDLILKWLLEFEKQILSSTAELKQFRNQRNSSKAKEFLEKIENLKYRETILRNLANSIAWQIIGRQLYIARRLFLGESPPTLSTSNFHSVKSKVDSLNSDSPYEFALISDLTTFIQVGDILFRKQNNYYIIEVKEGEKNEETARIIEKYNSEGVEITKDNLGKEFNKKLAKQVYRFNSQLQRGHRASHLLSTEDGYDPKTNTSMKITECSEPIKYYYFELQNVIKESKEKGIGYELIDDGMLLIGSFKIEIAENAHTLMKEIIIDYTKKGFPIFDFTQNLHIPLSEPIFCKPINEEYKYDIVFGQIRVLFALNFERIIEEFMAFGVNARWLSNKETHKLKETKPSGLLYIENSALGITYKGFDFVLGDAFISRIVSDNMSPTSAILVYLNILDESIKNMK